MKEYSVDLATYRLQRAAHTLRVSETLLESRCFSDSVNRSYYSAFYAINAVHALTGTAYKRHKDAVANFNKDYVATGRVPKEIGRDLASLERARNAEDYDDFQITSKTDAEDNYRRANSIVKAASKYCADNGVNPKRVELAYYVTREELQEIIDYIPKSIFDNSTVQEIIATYRKTLNE